MTAMALKHFKSQADAKRVIQASIDTNEQAVYKALRLIHARQTAAEQAAHTTTDANGIGFGAFDAEFLTEMADRLRRYGRLTERQLAVTRTKIRKYWKQLMHLKETTP